MENTDIFEFIDDDFFAIEIAKKIAYRLLKHPKINPKQIIGLGNALYALERLPAITKGKYCEFGVEYRQGTEEFHEMRCIQITISDCFFEISQGGSVYDKDVGGDSFSDPDWRIEVGGYRETECDLFGIESTVEEYLNLGAGITVNDESDFTENDESICMNDKCLTYKDKIISFIAENTCKEIEGKIVRSLQKMTDNLLSGDDSPLKNTWDEICVQVQQDKFFYWEAYLSVIESLIKNEVEQLEFEIKQAIWLQTSEGIEWAENNKEEGTLAIDENDIVEHIISCYILRSAGNWTNKDIEEYLYGGEF